MTEGISEGIHTELLLFMASVFMGAVLFLLYDIFRIFRRIVPHGVIWIGIEDFLYWIVCTVNIFLLLYWENDGMIRGFVIGGVILGMCLYFFLLSRFVIRFQVCILKQILGKIQKIVHFLFYPAWKTFRKILDFVYKQLKKIYKAVKISLCKL